MLLRVGGIFYAQKEINMTNQIENEYDDDDYDEDDYIDFLREDQWENSTAYQAMIAKMPPNWYPVKIVNFRQTTLSEIRGWLKDNCQKKYREDGFHSGCSYHVAIMFENPTDAIMFKLRWC